MRHSHSFYENRTFEIDAAKRHARFLPGQAPGLRTDATALSHRASIATPGARAPREPAWICYHPPMLDRSRWIALILGARSPAAGEVAQRDRGDVLADELARRVAGEPGGEK